MQLKFQVAFGLALEAGWEMRRAAPVLLYQANVLSLLARRLPKIARGCLHLDNIASKMPRLRILFYLSGDFSYGQ